MAKKQAFFKASLTTRQFWTAPLSSRRYNEEEGKKPRLKGRWGKARGTREKSTKQRPNVKGFQASFKQKSSSGLKLLPVCYAFRLSKRKRTLHIESTRMCLVFAPVWWLISATDPLIRHESSSVSLPQPQLPLRSSSEVKGWKGHWCDAGEPSE